MKLMQWIVCCLLGLAIVVPTRPVHADVTSYPDRPVRLVVPFPPGGGADTTARMLAQKMSERLGQPIVIENKPGANGLIGTDAVAKAKPDGYTILMTDRGALGINPSLYAKLPYDSRKDFASIGIATDGPYVLVMSSAFPVKSLADLVALAKSKPGALRYASYGVGSMAQLNIEALARAEGIELQHIPYKGPTPAVAAVVAGQVDLTIASPPSLLGFIKDGRVRALAVGSDTRLALLPDVPTTKEAGLASQTLIPTYFALCAPAGTPRAIVDRLNEELRRALQSPDVAEKLRAAGLVPDGGSPAAMTKIVAEDVDRLRTCKRPPPDHPERYLLAKSCPPEVVCLDDTMTFDLWSRPADGDERTPYLERFIHGRIYAARPDVGAVVHGHAPAVVPFAASSVPLAPIYHMSSFLGRGAPVFEMRDHFAMTDLLVRDNEQATRLAESIAHGAVVLMRGHGFCAVGRDLPEAVFRAHYTQQNAEVQQRAIALGGKVDYLDARECELATETNRQVTSRPWALWRAKFAVT
jgi:tripartite-type tricarboxylate transporter receptor subunit TctC